MKGSSFEHQLLRSARGDVPSAERRRANRACVMQAAGFTVTATATISTMGAATKTTIGSTTATVAASATNGITATKLVLLVSLGLACAGGLGAVVAATSHDERPQPSAAVASGVAVPSGAPAQRPAITTVAPPPTTRPFETTAAQTPPVHARVPVRTADTRGAAPPAAVVDELSQEAAWVEGARRCLKAGDWPCASEKLSAYDERFPHGALAEEVMVLRIEIARARGDEDMARRLAQQLLVASPSGPYARRARAVLTDPAARPAGDPQRTER